MPRLANPEMPEKITISIYLEDYHKIASQLKYPESIADAIHRILNKKEYFIS